MDRVSYRKIQICGNKVSTKFGTIYTRNIVKSPGKKSRCSGVNRAKVSFV